MRFDIGAIRLELADSPLVYAPSDDTELLASAALAAAVSGSSILEIGTGSGAVILSLAKSGQMFKALVAVDISKEAVETAKANAKKNGVPSAAVRFLQSDLFASLPSSRFDLILFNPPYLPTAHSDKVKGSLNLALDGGRDGLKTVRRFLAEAGHFLAPDGRILLVVSSLQPQDKLEALLLQHHFAYNSLSSQSFFFERLQIWELIRQ
jgi:release factor glutamine methyltransferase